MTNFFEFSPTICDRQTTIRERWPLPFTIPRIYPLFLIAAIMLAEAASAQVNVNNVIFTFAAGARPVQNILVTNSSANPVYVSVSTEAMIDYTSDPIKTAPTEDIVVSPRKFSIEGKGQRTVRILLKKAPGDIERGYRVYFVPQEGEFDTQTVTSSDKGRIAVIKVATGVGVLVFADPIERKVKFETARDSTGITFTNAGNIQVYLGDGKACPTEVPFPAIGATTTETEKDVGRCTDVPSQRVYPGKAFRVSVAPTNAVRFLSRVGSAGDYEPLIVPAFATKTDASKN